MSDMRDTFVKTMDNEEGGMMGRIDQFNELLKEKDLEVGHELAIVAGMQWGTSRE